MSKPRSYDLKITVTCRMNSTEKEVQKTIETVNRDLERVRVAAANGDLESVKALGVLTNLFGNSDDLNEQNFDEVGGRLMRKALREDFRQTKELDFSSDALTGHQIKVEITPRGESQSIPLPTAAWPFPKSE